MELQNDLKRVGLLFLIAEAGVSGFVVLAELRVYVWRLVAILLESF